MEEADVVRIVESSIAKKNESLLASMKSMLESSLPDLKRSHAETADSRLNEIKKLKFDEPHRFKKKGNEDQYRFNLKVGDTIEEAKEACSSQQLDKVHASLEKGEKLLSERQKHILLADKSDFGWFLIRDATISLRILTTKKRLFERKPEHEPKPSKTRLATRQDYPATERSFPFYCQPRPPLSGNFTLIVQDPFQQFRPAHRRNRDPVLLVTSQDIGGHCVLSILSSFSLLND